MSDTIALRKDLHARLKKANRAVLSTCGVDQQPHSSVVWYFTMGEAFELFIFTRRHTKKFTDILTNPKVGLVVGFGPKPETIQMHGLAEPITSAAGKAALAEHIAQSPSLKKLYFQPQSTSPFLKMEGMDVEFIRIKLSWVRRMHVPPGGTRAVFQEIRS